MLIYIIIYTLMSAGDGCSDKAANIICEAGERKAGGVV